MKKGFTLIEIIVCVALLGILGVFSVMIAINTGNNNELEKITKIVLEAANVYVETEKDENGNTYSYGIDNGGKGVTIPLNALVNKGYVKEGDSNKIKSLVKYNDDKDYYVLLAETSDLCDTGAKFTKASWEIDNEEIYLCDYTSGGGYDSNTLYGKIVKEYEENGLSGCIPGYNDSLCMIEGENVTIDGEKVYYYAGTNQNNYLKIVDKEGNELHKFYIVRTTEDKNVKVMTIDYTEHAPIYYHPLNEEFSLDKFIEVMFHINGSDHIEEYEWYKFPVIRNYEFKFSYEGYNFYKITQASKYEVLYFDGDNSDIESWDRESYIDIDNIRIYSKYYSLYKKLEDWYNKLNFDTEKYTKNSLWCGFPNYKDYINSDMYINSVNINLNCQEKTLNSKFGLLSNDEYYAIGKSINNDPMDKWDFSIQVYNDVFDNCDDTYELTFSFDSTYKPLNDRAVSCGQANKNAIYIRPAIVLDGNMEVISGTGDINDPYVVLGE